MASGVIDDEGNRLELNSGNNARYHSDWCSMIYSRLLIARNLLSDDGLIFISIDDYEQENLHKICNEVFGEECFVNIFIWKRNSSGKTEKEKYTINTEYILLYCKNRLNCTLQSAFKSLAEATKAMYSKDDNDGRGRYRLYPLQKPASPGPETTYDYVDNNGKVWPCPPKGWRMKYEKLKALENDGRLCLDNKSLSEKAYWNERKNEGKRIDTLWDDLPENSVGTKEISKLFDGHAVFSNPKPIELIIRCMQIATKNDDIVMDFFSGSASTAHAVIKLNAEELANRKYILVQLPEQCNSDSIAFKSGARNICDIGKERIRRAGEQIKASLPEDKQAALDIGFRVFKVDSTNMKDVYYSADKITQKSLLDMVSNIKEDRTADDLLFACLLNWGVPISGRYTAEQIDGCTVLDYEDGAMLACFDERVPESVVTAMAERQPLRAVFRDSSFADSPAKINVAEIFKRLSPDTSLRVL